MKERDLLNILAICLIFKQIPIYRTEQTRIYGGEGYGGILKIKKYLST